MNKAESLVFGMAIGAGLVYFLDQDKGARRRAVIRDQLVHAGHELDNATRAVARHTRNRGIGMLYEVKAGLTEREVDDVVLEERVRSEMGRTISNPGAITVTAARGHVTLSGDVPSVEVQEFVRKVKAIRGVQHVANQLTVHPRPDVTPSLQGSGVRGARGEENAGGG